MQWMRSAQPVWLALAAVIANAALVAARRKDAGLPILLVYEQEVESGLEFQPIYSSLQHHHHQHHLGSTVRVSVGARCLLQSTTSVNASAVVVASHDRLPVNQTHFNIVMATLSDAVGLHGMTTDGSEGPMQGRHKILAIVVALTLAIVSIMGFLSMYRLLRHFTQSYTVFHTHEEADSESVALMCWEWDYQPWTLVFRGLMATGRQALVLVYVYFQICMWNPNKLKILVHCDYATVEPGSYWPYRCEATKAMARSLPLLCATFSMIITARFIIQQRLYYVLLKKGILIDYTNHFFYTDVTVWAIFVCFFIGLWHWIEGILTLSLNQIQSVLFSYLVPCIVFFILFESAFDIERHLVPLAKIFDERPTWARAHLSSAIIVPERAICERLQEARDQFRREFPAGYSLLDLIEVAANKAKAMHIESSFDAGVAYEEHLARRCLTTGVFQGLWPAGLLMDPRHTDPGSVRFRKAIFAFYGLFMVTQAIVIALLTASIWQDFIEGLPDQRPQGAIEFGGMYYISFGNGYCRGPQLSRPYGMYRSLLEIDRNGCGEQCSEIPECLGFAIGLDLCTVYTSEPVQREGWSQRISTGRLSRRISSTNEAQEVDCMVRMTKDGRSEDWLAASVQFVFLMLLVVMLHAGAAGAFGHSGILKRIRSREFL